MRKWSVNKEDHNHALNDLLIGLVGKDQALILKQERGKMSEKKDIKTLQENVQRLFSMVARVEENTDYLIDEHHKKVDTDKSDKHQFDALKQEVRYMKEAVYDISKYLSKTP